MQFLVADDDVAAAEMYRVALEAGGHIVTVALDGQECLQSYNEAISRMRQAGKRPSNNQPFDAVVLDYKMPLVDGLQVAKEILKNNAAQRIVFASAYVKETLMDSVKELNQVMELIQKPFEPDVLVDLVEDTTTFSSLTDLNLTVVNMVKKSGNASDKGQIDTLMRLLKKIQRPGTI